VSEDASVERLSVAEAAQALGVTRDAIHKRIRRGTIEHEQGADGRFYVYVDTSTLGLDSSTDTSADASTDAAGEAPLVEELRDRVRYLERQVEDEREARRRADMLLAQLMQRIPELEAPPTPTKTEPTEPAEPADPARAEPERERPERSEPERVEPQRVDTEKVEPPSRENPHRAPPLVIPSRRRRRRPGERLRASVVELLGIALPGALEENTREQI